jgi:hypothetical protein
MKRGEVQIVVTTAEFRRGQAAAWRDFEKDPDSTPNHDLLARLHSEEFAVGYVDEWETFCVPARARLDRED